MFKKIVKAAYFSLKHQHLLYYTVFTNSSALLCKNVLYFYSDFLQCGAKKNNTSVISNCPLLQLCIPPLSESLCFGTCLFKARLLNTHSAPDWSVRTLLSQHQSPHLSWRCLFA